MWDTAQGLAKLFYASQWAMALLGALTAIAIVFSIVVSIRKDQIVAREQEAADARAQSTIITQDGKISSLTEELGKAKKNLSELISQRALSHDQKIKIIAFLKKSSPQETMIMKTADLETQTFAEEIAQVLKDGNWKIDPMPFRIITHAEPGMLLMVQNLDAAPLGAVILQNAFKEAGITVNGAASNDVEAGKFILWIGPKRIVKTEPSDPH